MFNLKWWKTKKKEEELLDLQIRKEKLLNESLERDLKFQEGLDDIPKPTLQNNPYRKLKFVNNVLTVVFNDGSVINKPQATINDFELARAAYSEDQIIDIMKGDEEDEELDNDVTPTHNDISLVSSFPDFETKEECLYMNGIERSLPPLLVKRFGEILSKYDKNNPNWETNINNDIEYTSLKKFWLKCTLNPNAQSAEDLYTFLSNHNMKIDRHGNFFAYRRVCGVNSYIKDEYGASNRIVDVISNAYNNVKAVWKKRADDFRIEELNGEYSIHKCTSTPKGTIIGNLDTLYRDLPNMKENRYTDAHTHHMDYRVGEIASIPRNECDDNNNINCSKGLHAASKAYNYSGFGDTPILMIINPMDAVAVPLNETGKLRVSRWFFAMTLSEEDRHILDDKDFEVTNLGDIFEEKCLKNIEQHAHTSFTEEVKRHTFTIPQMSNVDIKNISDMLKKMNDVIKNRIINQ